MTIYRIYQAGNVSIQICRFHPNGGYALIGTYILRNFYFRESVDILQLCADAYDRSNIWLKNKNIPNRRSR